jgi:hypothetical protein
VLLSLVAFLYVDEGERREGKYNVSELLCLLQMNANSNWLRNSPAYSFPFTNVPK